MVPASRPRTDLRLLLALFAIAASAWTFVTLAGLVRQGATQELDETVVRALRDPHDPGLVVGGEIAAELARDVTALGSIAVLVVVVLAVVGFLALERLHGSLLLVAVASIGGTVWTFALKELFSRPRPALLTDVVTSTSSFPSGHSSLSAVIYLTLAVLLARLVERRALRVYVIGVAVVMTIAIGISRVALGVHYPSDVLAGWTLGLGWALMCWTGMGILQRRGAVETVQEAHEVAAELAHRDPAPDAGTDDVVEPASPPAAE